jgi:hypothetical protein
VRLSSGRFAWVDDDAVMLGEMKSTDDMPQFFLRGWNEDGTDAARVENFDRIRRYLELCKVWEGPGLAERVSEVNLQDVRDVRAQLAGDDSQIEVRLGSQDMGKRLKQALEVLDEQRKTSRGSFISYVDLTQGKRAIVGFVSGAQAISESPVTVAEAKPRTVTSDKKQPPAAKPVAQNQKSKTHERAKKETR